MRCSSARVTSQSSSTGLRSACSVSSGNRGRAPSATWQAASSWMSAWRSGSLGLVAIGRVYRRTAGAAAETCPRVSSAPAPAQHGRFLGLTLPERWSEPLACPRPLVGGRANQRHDQEEREGYQEVESAARDEAYNLGRRRRGPDFLHEPECVGPSSPGATGGAESLGGTAATQLRENEFAGECCTFPDESVPLASRESVPAEIASGRGTPSRLGGFGLRFALSGKRGGAAEAAPPDRLPVDWQIQAHLAAKRNGSREPVRV